MVTNITIKTHEQVLTELNDGYVKAYVEGDVKFFERVLADDFVSAEPNAQRRTKTQFLEMMKEPRPAKEMKAHDVLIRIFDGFAVVHGALTFKNLNGEDRRGCYTDDYILRDGNWVCICGTVIAEIN